MGEWSGTWSFGHLSPPSLRGSTRIRAESAHSTWIHAECCGVRVDPRGMCGVRAEHLGQCKVLSSTDLHHDCHCEPRTTSNPTSSSKITDSKHVVTSKETFKLSQELSTIYSANNIFSYCEALHVCFLLGGSFEYQLHRLLCCLHTQSSK